MERSDRAAIAAFGEVAAALSEVRDLDDLLHLIADKMCELVGVRRCSVYLRDEQTGLFRGQVGRADQDIDASVKRLIAGLPADRFTQEIVETRQPVLVADATADPRPVRSTMRAWGVRSMLGVPMLFQDEVIGIFFLDDEERVPDFSEERRAIAAAFADLAAVAISQARAYAEVRRSAETVARQNALLRRVAAMDDRLAALAAAGAEQAEIAAAVAELSGRPTGIYDAHWRQRATASPEGARGLRPPVLDAEAAAMPEVRGALASLDADEPAILGPFPAAGILHRFLVAPITLREERWGHVVLLEAGSRLNALDRHIARRAAMNVAMELLAERRAAAVEWANRAALLADLIRGDRPADLLWARAELLGFDVGATHVLCLVAAAAGEEAKALPSPRELARALRPLSAAPVIATPTGEGTLAALALAEAALGRPVVDRVRRDVARLLGELDPDGGFVAALSAPAERPEHYPRAYAECREVLGCLRTFGSRGGTVLAADQLGAGRLLLASQDRDAARRFADQTLGPALEADPALMTTLETFLDCGRNVRACARRLGIHENTVRYRLRRLEELTGLAVGSSSEDELTAHLALRVLQLEGRWPWAETALEKSTSR